MKIETVSYNLYCSDKQKMSDHSARDTLRQLIFNEEIDEDLRQFTKEFMINNDTEALLTQLLHASENRADYAFQKFLWLYQFRKQHDIIHTSSYLLNREDYKYVRMYLPQTIHGHDKAGCPCYWIRFGQLDLLTLLNHVSMDNILFQLFQGIEYIRNSLFQDLSKEYNTTVNKVVLVVDLDGLSMSLFFGESRKYLMALARAALCYYPELLKYMIVFNCGLAFKVGWAFAQYCLDPETRKKIIVIRDSNVEEFSKYIDKQYIPKEYNGDCCCEKGCIPSKEHPFTEGTDRMDHYFSENSKHYKLIKPWDQLNLVPNDQTSSIVSSHDNQWKTINLKDNDYCCKILQWEQPKEPKKIFDIIPKIESLW